MTLSRRARLGAFASGLALVAVIVAAPVASRGDERKAPAIDVAKLNAARARAIEFLRTTQLEEGGWTLPTQPGISGLITASLLRAGVQPDDPMIVKAFKHLDSFIQEDGGIYDLKSSHRNYETSICLLAYADGNVNGRNDTTIARARDFLKKLQWDDAEGAAPDDVRFGGAGYGKSQRPDLSNTAFLLDALKAAGVDKNDDAMKNALVFVSRCQNLESQYNTTEFASKVNDGGFYYTPAAGGSSQAGKEDNGGLRSYASMTYAGLKSMIYAGLDSDDPRVAAAVKWIQKHYSLAENPGMGQQGLYYYFHTFAKALDALGSATLTDAQGQTHDWRNELGNRLLSLQKENGSWVNPERRWMEGDPNLATAYVLLTLEYCEPRSAAR